MSHQQDIARIEEQIENSPAAQVRSTRLLLAALNEVQAERNRLADVNAEVRAALLAWQATYPDLGDPHDSHPRGHFYSNCPGCVDELKLYTLADKLAGNEWPVVGRESVS